MAMAKFTTARLAKIRKGKGGLKEEGPINGGQIKSGRVDQ